jgi:hypothetical protein
MRRGNRFRVDRQASELRGDRFSGRRLVLVLVAAVALVCGALPGASFAAKTPSGVHVDPHSPVGKEYAIPLSQARGGGGSSSGGNLFGSGITKQPTSPSTGSAGSGGTNGAGSGATSGGSGSSPKSSGHRRTRHAAGNGHHRARSTSSGSGASPTATPVTATPVASKPVTAAVATHALGASHGSGLLWMALAALVVLVIGTVGGLAIKQRNRGVAPRTG